MDYDAPIELVLNRVGVGFMVGMVWHYMWMMTKPRIATDILEGL